MRPFQDVDSLIPAFESWQTGNYQRPSVFHLYAAATPLPAGSSPGKGLDAFITWIQTLSFDPEYIQYLGARRGTEGRSLFDESFLNYLQRFFFNCDIDIVPFEDQLIPGELLLRIRGALIQVQLVQAALEQLMGGTLVEEIHAVDSFLIPIFRAGQLVYQTD
ncbi:MAG: hypothetical protein IPL49_04605 [Saprospirales bacterium]|nr:hypothetical protein [Saprospirales bacterium]MBK8490192.1 hypothetical protein [Saprospirales bacterium]